MSKDERSKLYKERIILKRQKAEMFSLWCDALYRLSLANHVFKYIYIYIDIFLKQFNIKKIKLITVLW